MRCRHGVAQTRCHVLRSNSLFENNKSNAFTFGRGSLSHLSSFSDYPERRTPLLRRLEVEKSLRNQKDAIEVQAAVQTMMLSDADREIFY